MAAAAEAAPPFASHTAACVGALGGVGWVLDPNRDWHAAHPAAFAPRPAFYLAAPYIKALGSDATEERDRKRRRKWEQHPDATEPSLVDALSRAHGSLVRLPVCMRFFAGAAGSLEQVPAQAPAPPLDQGLVPLCAGEHAAAHGEERGGAHTRPDARPEPLVLDPDDADAERDRSVALGGGRLVVVGPGAHHARLALAGESYLVPPSSAFFLGDAAQGLRSLCGLHMRYELLVLDPPWPSKSRGKHYRSMTVADLSALPVGQLLRPGGVLALWVTNDRKLVDAAQTRILEAWGLEAVATWYWLKVTCDGQLCSPLESPHKKPFERA